MLTPEQIEAARKTTGRPSLQMPAQQGSLIDDIHQETLPKRGFTENILPVGGAILGGLGGAALGALGGPLGAFAGGVAGAGLGGAAGEGAQQKIEQSAGARKSLSPKDIAKEGATSAAFQAVGGPVAKVAGKVVQAGGRTLAKMFIPTGAREAQLLQTHYASKSAMNNFAQRFGSALGITTSDKPTTVAETALQKGLMGTETGIGVRAKRVQNDLWSSLVQPALKQAEQTIPTKQFFNEARENIMLETADPTRRAPLLKALEAIEQDFKNIRVMNMEQLQKYKEGFAQFVPQKVYRGEDVAGAANDVRAKLAALARDKIYGALGPNVQQAYIDYGNLHALTELGQKAMTGAKFKGGAGSYLSALFEMAAVPVGTVAGQTIYRIGRLVEMVGPPGAQTLRGVLGLPDKETSNPGR